MLKERHLWLAGITIGVLAPALIVFFARFGQLTSSFQVDSVPNSDGHPVNPTDDETFGQPVTQESAAAILATAQAEAAVATAQSQVAAATAAPTSTPMSPDSFSFQNSKTTIIIVKNGQSLYSAVKGAVDAGSISFPIFWVEGDETLKDLGELPDDYRPGDTFTLQSLQMGAPQQETPVVRAKPQQPSRAQAEQSSVPVESQSGIFSGVESGKRYWVKLRETSDVVMQKQVWLFYEGGVWWYQFSSLDAKKPAEGVIVQVGE
jgi:hypothetical protein